MKYLNQTALSKLREQHQGKVIVHCHGVYDLLHYGHLLHLESAKKFGDVLVVSITEDCFVNKGPNRPYNSSQKRSTMLAALSIVDYVYINDAPTAIPVIEQLKPHFYVKGPDYRDQNQDLTGEIYNEEQAVKQWGGELVFTKDEQHSSTTLLNQYFSSWNERQQSAIDQIKQKYSKGAISALVERMKGLKILILGEPIIDTYVFCKPLAISSKSPSISAEFMREENYTGGTLAIAKHLDALGCEVSLLVAHGNEVLTRSLLDDIKQETNIKVREHIVNAPTPRKTRYLQPFNAQKMFEITNINNDQWVMQDMRGYLQQQQELASEHDFAIIADFGHGLYEGECLAALKSLACPIALNVQTNSSNLGFNVFTKHSQFDYLCIDEKELRLGMHDRYSDVLSLAYKACQGHQIAKLTTTLGDKGSLCLWNNGQTHCMMPSLFSQTVDTTGAGDAYFAFTAVLDFLGEEAEVSAFLGNIYAGLKAQIIGNKSAVNTVDFVRTVHAVIG